MIYGPDDSKTKETALILFHYASSSFGSVRLDKHTTRVPSLENSSIPATESFIKEEEEFRNREKVRKRDYLLKLVTFT